MRPPGGGGRSIRRAGGETAIPDLGRWEDRPNETNSDRRSISGDTVPAKIGNGDDPATNLSYWGTGNGGPWMGDQRPGDNLYTSSTLAIDVATGAIKGHHQYHPNDSWDWDEVSPPILVDYQRNGRTIKGLIDVARDGYLWFLERTDSKINFIDTPGSLDFYGDALAGLTAAFGVVPVYGVKTPSHW